MTKVRFLVASCLGIGLSPFAPGTAGSIPGVLLYWVLWSVAGWPATLCCFLAVTLLGFWSAGEVERRYGEKDPGVVVIDEVSGQMLTLLFLAPTTQTLVAGFLLFRLLDILKPFPGRRLEKLAGASGIMADDLVAGLYGNLILRALALLAPGWMGLM
jgi:phosphatidylglycerophosphatase A